MSLKRHASCVTILDQDAAAKAKKLRITIPCTTLGPSSSTSGSSLDSLFDESEGHSDSTVPMASLDAPDIDGLYFDPALSVPDECAKTVVDFCQTAYFRNAGSNQVMLFGRFNPDDPSTSSCSGLPQPLVSLLDTISDILRPSLPPQTYELLFPEKPTQARQAIVNLYLPGEGITPHVDLLGRYADGIIGVSFGSGSVMRFDEVEATGEKETRRHDLYLPERSLVVLSKAARYRWTHGIDKRTHDYVAIPTSASESGIPQSPHCRGTWIARGIRLSVTFRWMLEGADLVGAS